MKKVVLVIGVIVYALMMYSIPILTVLSFVAHWNGLVKTFLLAAATIQLIWLMCTAYDASGGDD